MEHRLNRREFLGRAAAVGLASAAARETAAAPPAELAQRTLGRTGYKTSILALGMAPIGMGGHTMAEAERLVNEAIDSGINYVDVAPNYANAEEKLGSVMKRRRSEVFLVTKVESQDRVGILNQIRSSLRLLQTDHVDAVHLHNLGDFDLKQVFEDENGGIAALKEAKQKGYLRYFGISGHMRPWKFTKAIATGEIDLVMSAMNFVDRHTYDFETNVLAEAKKHNTAMVAMKVLGGARNMDYTRPMPGLLADHYEDAIRYALGLPNLSAIVVGLRDSAEIKKAVSTVRDYRPLTQAETDALLARGREMARNLGPHFGPVT